MSDEEQPERAYTGDEDPRKGPDGIYRIEPSSTAPRPADDRDDPTAIRPHRDLPTRPATDSRPAGSPPPPASEPVKVTRRGRVLFSFVVAALLLGGTIAAAVRLDSALVWLVGIPLVVVAALVGVLGRTAAFTAASTVLPGLGLVGAPSRVAKVVGVVLPVALLSVIAWMGFAAAADLGDFAGFAVNPTELRTLTVTMIVGGLIWVALIAGTHLLTRPKGWGWGHRALGALLVTTLSFGVAGSAALAARYAYDQQKLVNTVFAQEDEVKSTSRPTIDGKEKDPWRNTPRINVMLLGADSADSRDDEEGLRADTIMVASIDTSTGATTIVQIPRNVQYTPFPEGSALHERYPRGFRGEGDPAQFYINALWRGSETYFPDLFEDQTYPGAEAMKQGVEGITGLKIDYFTLLNIDGVQRLIDAMGGVSVNINERLPIGGNTTGKRPTGWLEPGPDQQLNGYDAMWYARSRSDSSDYARMARQSCLVDAIIKQANPRTMLSSYEAIASASADMVMTDIPQQVLEPLVSLSLKVKDAKINRLVFAPGKNGYDYVNPDFDVMRQSVQDAIETTSATASATEPVPSEEATPSPEPSAEDSPSPEASPSPRPTFVEGAQEVEDACAYDPV